MDTGKFEARKREHIQHSLDPAHQAFGLNGLDQIHLIHEALPDLDFSEIQLTSQCLGKDSLTPFYISGMTAGHEAAREINRTLAKACQERGWAMGVGSQRRDLEMFSSATGSSSSFSSLDDWKKLREEVPTLTLFANLGLSQLIQADPKRVLKVVQEIQAQALVIHTNPLQEALQPEGTPTFKGSWDVLAKYCKDFPIPILLKETGCGFSRATLVRLSTLGLAAIDLSGLGGTHWGRIEGARAGEGTIQAQAALTFANWGESTVKSVSAAHQVLPSTTEIWASGGVRSGLDAAKLIALGAHQVGFAKPALEAALKGSESLHTWMATREFELKVALFCTGSINCRVLRQKKGAWQMEQTDVKFYGEYGE